MKFPILTIFSIIFYQTLATEHTTIKELQVLLQQKNFQQLHDVSRSILLEQPYNQKAQLYLAISLFELKQITEAEKLLKNITNEHTSQSIVHFYLAKIALHNKQKNIALHEFKQAIELDPTHKDAVYGIVEELKEQLKTEEAVTYLRNVLIHHPHDIILEFTLANTLNMAGHTQEALDMYLKLNNRLPNDPGIVYNIAYTYKKLGLLQEALPFYEKSLHIKPDHQEALFSQGLAYLVTGDWEKGWKGYEHRWARSEHVRIRNYDKPMWNNEELYNKTIFVYAEQGLGDTFQFIRYLKILKNRGARVVFAPQRPLMTLLKLCPYIDEIIPFAERPAHFDYHIPLVSIPYIVKTRLDSVPHEIPYLYADEQLIQEWHTRLSDDSTIKVGICWQGNSEYSTPFLKAAVAGKSMPAEYFEPLSRIPGVTLYCLQHITGTNQLATLPPTMKLVTFDDIDNAHGRFMDTAAIIKNLDLVITIDTSICHLAAALGCEVWNLLPNPPDWRWMLDCADTPWYQNMKLFRQPTPGNWHNVIAQVNNALIYRVAEKTNIPFEYVKLMTQYRNELAFLKQQKKELESTPHNNFLQKQIDTIQAKINVLETIYKEAA
ncbi:MAG TPA: tetratricopeptide repeat protein [Candidatus Babeliales bacterium]|jgi:tetratricopeptide (TPR) repeat protein|nr:tetratricopeptide repeat protein [Candidatus Babeliales bacterium]